MAGETGGLGDSGSPVPSQPHACGLHQSSQQPQEANSVTVSGWQARKLRLRGATSLAPSHMELGFQLRAP